MREDPARTRAIRQRDPQVLGEVVREVLPGLLRAARAAGLEWAAAEDAAQETLLVLMDRATDFDGRARVGAWLHGILFYKIQEQRRVLTRHQDHDSIDDVVESRFRADGRWGRPPADPDHALLAAEIRSAVGQCLKGIPDAQRLAFVLREVEGQTTEEICKILSVSANNLGVLLFRARNRLRECLEAHAIEGSTDADLS